MGFNTFRLLHSLLTEQLDTTTQILIGNKSDLQDSEREVTRARGAALALTYGIPFMETSAVADSNVKQAFETIALDVVARLEAEKAALKPSTAGHVEDPSIRVGSQFKGKAKKKSGCF